MVTDDMALETSPELNSKTDELTPIEKLKQQLSKQPARKHLDVEEMRRNTQGLAQLNKPDENILCQSIEIAGVSCLSVRAPNIASSSKILYIHGGGFIAGSAKTVAGLAGVLSKASDAEIISVDYRLAPEHPFPAALEDCLSVYEALLETDGNALAVAGDSAGGGLALSLWLYSRDKNLALPQAIMLFCPWLDLSYPKSVKNAKSHPLLSWAQLTQMADLYVGRSDPTNKLISPLYGDITGLPPLYIQAAGDDILLRDAKRLKQKAEDNDQTVQLDIWADMIHVWQGLTELLPEAKEALNRAGQWLRRQR